MRITDSRKSPHISLIILVLIFFAISCKKEINTDYVGYWETTKAWKLSDNYFAGVQYFLILTPSGFIETFNEWPDDNSANDLRNIKIEGELSVSGNELTFTPTKIYFAKFNKLTQTLSAPYEIYNSNDAIFDSIISSLKMITSGNTVEYSVIEERLSILIVYTAYTYRNDEYRKVIFRN